MKQGGNCLTVHDVGERNPHTERADNPLNHHELCHVDSIIEADVAEEDCGEHTVNGVRFQVIYCCRDHSSQLTRFRDLIPL